MTYTCGNCGHTKAAKNIEKDIQIIAGYFNVKEDDILGRSIAREHSYPRQVVMYLLAERRKQYFLSLDKISLILNRRGGSTVIHACKTIQGLSDTEIKVREDINNIRKLLA